MLICVTLAFIMRNGKNEFQRAKYSASTLEKNNREMGRGRRISKSSSDKNQAPVRNEADLPRGLSCCITIGLPGFQATETIINICSAAEGYVEEKPTFSMRRCH
jgi:hypothetical protein